MKPANWLILQKKVRFGDCDSAGVIHFHNLLKWSQEAWEESIEIYGIPCHDIFPDFSIRKSQIIFPIVNCEANFRAPIKIGDLLKVKIAPHKINTHLFQVNSFFIKGVDENCYFFNDVNDLNKLNSFLKQSQDTALHKKLFIVGGGPSGIELACKIKDIFSDQFEINVIEKSNEILNKNKIFNREQAEKALGKRKIKVLGKSCSVTCI